MDGKRRNKINVLLGFALVLALAASLVMAQQQPNGAPPGQAEIPDAPSATKPPE